MWSLTCRFFAVAAAFQLLMVALVPSAEAEILVSCQVFRVALWRAIDDDGDKVAHPRFDKAAGGFGPIASYEMTGIAGLDGRLNCSDDNIVFNFSATAHISSDPTEANARFGQLKNLAAAAICALSSPQPTMQECTPLADAIVRGAMDEYAARVRGEPRRYVGARLKGGSRIEMEAEKDRLAFFLYPF